MGSRGWPLLRRQRFGDRGGLQHSDDGDRDHGAGQLRHDRPLRRQRRQPLQLGNHRHERPFVLHHLERHRREPENVVADDQLGEHPGGHAQDGEPDERLRPGLRASA